MSWSDSSNNEDGFIVKIAIDKDFTQSVQTFIVGPNVTNYLITLLAPSTKYYMRVAAFNAAGSSAWSLILADKTLK